MPQPARLVVLNMAMNGSIDVGAFSQILTALTKYPKIGGLVELEEFLANPSGTAVAMPQWGSGFDLEAVSKRAQDSCVAVQNLTLDGLQKMLSGKSAAQVIEQLGL